MRCRFWIIHIFLIERTWEAVAITNPSGIEQKSLRNFRRHIGSADTLDWEVGLREATHQAFLRERYNPPHLRDLLFAAAFTGKQRDTTPFGDIAIVARGQLYALPGGYQFVQDPYQNDCDNCHNPRTRCSRLRCDIWKPRARENLLALWTVKRIRHRDDITGHRYELEYTISPINDNNPAYLTKYGRFDYTTPGHVFVVKSGHKLNPENDNKLQPSTESIKWVRYPYYVPPNLKYLPEDEVYRSQSTIPQGQTTTASSRAKEIALYKMLIETLAAKTTTSDQTQQLEPHRFQFPTTSTTYSQSSTMEIVPRPPLTTKSGNQQIPTYVTGATTIVQLPTTHILPLSQFTPTKSIPVAILTPVQTTNQQTQYHATPAVATLVTAAITPEFSRRPTQPTFIVQSSPSPLTTVTQRPITTLHYYTPINEDHEFIEKPKISTKATTTRTRRPPIPSPKEVDEEEEENAFDLFSGTTTKKHPSRTETPSNAFPTSINEQLPPPDEHADTTVPYVTQRPLTSKRTRKPTISTTRTTQERRITRPSSTSTPSYSSSTAEYSKQTARGPSTIVEYEFSSTPRTLVPYLTVTPKTISTYIPSTQEIVSNNTSSTPDYGRFSSTLSPTLSTLGYKFATEVPSTRQQFTKPVTEGRQTTHIFPSTITQVGGSTRPHTTGTAQFVSSSTHLGTTQTQPGSTQTIYYIPTTVYDISSDSVISTIPVTSTKTQSTASDFLVDTQQGPPTVPRNKNIDYSNDDIFGPDVRLKLTTTEKAFKQVDSELARQLFGERKSRKSPNRDYHTTSRTTNSPKIIYSNFYQASTLPPLTSMYVFEEDDDANNEGNNLINTNSKLTTQKQVLPLTSQSFETSISYEINKINATTPTTTAKTVEFEPTIMAKLSEVVHNNSNIEIYKAEMPQDDYGLHENQETNKIFDDIALQLINHARSIDYLEKKNRTGRYNRRGGVRKVRRYRKKVE